MKQTSLQCIILLKHLYRRRLYDTLVSTTCQGGSYEKGDSNHIYIWNYNEDPKTHNTQHTIISGNVFDKLEDGVSVADWIYAAVNGDVQSHGLELLG